MLSQPFTSPAPAWPTGLRYIQNGDNLGTGNHETQAGDIAQALSYLKQAIGGDSTVPVTLHDVTVTDEIKTSIGGITRVVQAIPTAEDPSVWSINYAGFAIQTDDTLAHLRWELDLPHGATLVSASVYVKGAAGHMSLPAGTDRLLFAVGYSTNAGSTPGLGDAYDSSESVEDYEETHAINVAVSSHVVDRTANRYYAYLRNERGANYVVGAEVYNVELSFTPAIYDPG
jgi:hypothetical protein